MSIERRCNDVAQAVLTPKKKTMLHNNTSLPIVIVTRVYSGKTYVVVVHSVLPLYHRSPSSFTSISLEFPLLFLGISYSQRVSLQGPVRVRVPFVCTTTEEVSGRNTVGRASPRTTVKEAGANLVTASI